LKGGFFMPFEFGNFKDVLVDKGVSRRDFLKFCGVMAGTLALPNEFEAKIASALEETPKKTPVIWLEFQDCAGCSESFLRGSRPSAAEVVLDVLSVDYHETIMAPSGAQAEKSKADAIAAGGYLLIVEGSIPTAEDGIHCCISGHSAIDILQEAAVGAIAVVAVGNCAAFGGIPKASPNPTNAVAVSDLVTDKPVLNLPGCPVNVVNLTATVVHFLTFGALPAMDKLNRPLFAYGARIHDNCERRGHFNAGEFTREWGDDGHRKGWCLYQMGCKGPISYHNCPTVRWNEGVSWPVGAGHGCIGCSEPGFWERPTYVPVELHEFTPPSLYPDIEAPAESVSAVNAGVTGAVVGLAVGAAGAAAAMQLSKGREQEEDESAEE
jgi:hydrogenase small subunit